MIPIRGLRSPVTIAPKAPTPKRPAYRPPHSIWSDERERRLAELWATNLPITRIAERMEISPNAVAGKAFRMGLPRRENPARRQA